MPIHTSRREFLAWSTAALALERGAFARSAEERPAAGPLAAPANGRGEPGPLAPGQVVTRIYPDLPPCLAEMSTPKNTPVQMSFRLPQSFRPDRPTPLFVYLLGGPGGRGEARDLALGQSVIGTGDFITVTLPLFKRQLDRTEPAGGLMVSMDDFPAVSACYRTMLDDLQGLIPRIDQERSVFGGHSNGAHTTGILLAGQDESLLERFGAYFLHEGGVGPLFANVLQKRSFTRKRFLVMTAGGTAKNPAPFSPLVETLKTMTRRSLLDFTFVSMDGYGHDQPPEYLDVVGQWARREPLTDVLQRRKELATEIPWPLNAHPETAQWPRMLNADLSNTRHQGWHWNDDGTLSGGKGPLETKSDFGDFAVDLEFQGPLEVALGSKPLGPVAEDALPALPPQGQWNRLSARRHERRVIMFVNQKLALDRDISGDRERLSLSGGADVRCRNPRLVPLGGIAPGAT